MVTVTAHQCFIEAGLNNKFLFVYAIMYIRVCNYIYIYIYIYMYVYIYIYIYI